MVGMVENLIIQVKQVIGFEKAIVIKIWLCYKLLAFNTGKVNFIH